MLDASARVRTIRTVGSSAVGVTLLICSPWLGWWTLILFGLSALNLLSVDRRMARTSRPERVSVSAILITLALLATGVVLSGGPKSPALPWLVLPAAMVAARFRAQVVFAAVTLTAVVIALVTLGVDPRATLHDPVPVFAALALLTAVVSIVLALQSAEMHQRGEANVDPLTGLANRRQLAEDLQAVWAEVSGGRSVRLALFDLDGFKAYNDSFGHLGGDMLLTRLAQEFARTVAGAGAGCAYRLGGDEFCALLWDDVAEEVLESCVTALGAEGEGFRITSSYGSVLLPQEARDPQLALQLADERMYAHKESGRASAGKQTRDLALEIIAANEPQLHSHSSHVAELADGVARRLGISGAAHAELVRAAELHDIGKLAIPYSMLRKAGPLDAHEWKLMRHHPVVGASILSAAPALAGVAEIVAATHERYDGTGYPRGLAGQQIPMSSQIVFVCDSFDAMICERPFGEAKSEAQALRELRRCAGTQFDPRVVEAFIAEHAARRAAREQARAGSASLAGDGGGSAIARAAAPGGSRRA
ncbi:MAG TPA: HD domain-containing phosphohydrolase [Solirubrobacteraceae bacterium]|nr:HD domain-containing phosphohydrolase [Solirubrobacteraceae bacterium]